MQFGKNIDFALHQAQQEQQLAEINAATHIYLEAIGQTPTPEQVEQCADSLGNTLFALLANTPLNDPTIGIVEAHRRSLAKTTDHIVEKIMATGYLGDMPEAEREAAIWKRIADMKPTYLFARQSREKTAEAYMKGVENRAMMPKRKH